MSEKKIGKKRPQDIWNEKNGYISKSYKLKKNLTDEFAISCKKNNISQASVLTALMYHYINSNL